MTKENREIRWIEGKFVTLVSILAGFIIVVSGIIMSGSYSKTETFKTEWSVFKCKSDGSKSYMVTSDMLKANFKKSDKGTNIIATATVPYGDIDGVTLQMCLKRTAFKVYVGGVKVSSYEIGRYKKNEPLGNGYHFINIKPSDCGKRITIRLYMNKNDSYENIRELCFKKGNIVTTDIAQKNCILIFLCSFLIVLGIMLSITGTIFFFKEEYSQLLCIGFYSFLIGLYVLSSRYLLQIFNSNLLVNTFLEYFTMFLIPVPIVLYSLEIISEKRKFFRVYMKIYMIVDVIVTAAVAIAYFCYDLHLNRVSGYYRGFMIVGLLSLFIANFRKIFTNVDDKLRASVFWALIISNTIPLLSFVLSKNPGGMSDLPIYLMPVGNIYIILALLFSYLMNYMKIFKDDVERQVLLRMAYTDSMTGLYNRGRSMEEFEKIDNGSEPYCVVWLDLNYLKRTNDRYGHEEGDMLITRFSGILKNAFEDIGTVCRMGGDEFCVIIKKSMNDIKIKKCIDKMLELIDEDNKDEHRYFMQTSYGIAGSEEFDIPKTDGVCSRADERMYEMKVKMKAQRTD